MGSAPSKEVRGEDKPEYYDLKEMTDKWVQKMYTTALKSKLKGKSVCDVRVEYKYDGLKITDEEPDFQKRMDALNPEVQSIQYTTVVDEKEYINKTSVQQSSTFKAEGDLETTFSAELTKALMIEQQSCVSFTFDSKKLQGQHRLGKHVQRTVNIEEMREGRLKFETKDKVKWKAAYPLNVPPRKKVTAKLCVIAKEEVLEFTQTTKVEGHIRVNIFEKDSGEFITESTGSIDAIVNFTQGDNEEFDVTHKDQRGYVKFVNTGVVKLSLGVKEVVEVEEFALKK